VQGLFDEGRGAEKVAAFRNVDCAEFTSPRIDVLEDVSVDGPQVGDVELSFQRSCVQFDKPGCGRVRLEGG
jgi:hypothetical protein